MAARIEGLHHVTATVDDAQSDVDFYTRTLGIRLVKKTVNFDNHHVYHFYYGDEVGHPGTLFTTFPYKGKGVPWGRKGQGQINGTSFSVPRAALPAWRERFQELGIGGRVDQNRFGDETLTVEDPSTLVIELVGTDRDQRTAWIAPDLDRSLAIRGLHGVTLSIGRPDRSVEFLTRVLGYSVAGSESGRTRLQVGEGGPGKTLDIVEAPDAPAAINGLGTVHHVAMGVATAEDQLEFRERLASLGVPVTPVLDRQYFQSIYFREPGGVLYEIATLGPGFLVDEPRDALGTALKLPPWEEPNRAGIEAGLPPLRELAPKR
jgi:glyoxalase family protein